MMQSKCDGRRETSRGTAGLRGSVISAGMPDVVGVFLVSRAARPRSMLEKDERKKKESESFFECSL